MIHLLKYFKTLSLRPENAKEIRALILELAIRGRLTEEWRRENPDVEPASVLLERIREEKARLVKEKVIKKERSIPEIANDLSKIPSTWDHCQLIEICSYIQRGKSPKYAEVSPVPVISQKCVQWYGFELDRARFITEESLEKYADERFLQVDDLLWNSTGDGTVGRTILFPETDYEKVVADSHVTVVRPFKELISPNYLWLFTAAPSTQINVLGKVSGSTKQTELGTGTVKALAFPLPPLPEQKAIVATVNRLLAEVDELEQQTTRFQALRQDYVTASLRALTGEDSSGAWAALRPYFQAFFDQQNGVDRLREAVLELAVQGKLTARWREENPEVEPASVLLERIKEEKERLVREKVIRKDKKLPEVDLEEVPFAVPDSWEWCRMGNLAKKLGAGSTPLGGKTAYSQTGIKFFRSQNIYNWGLKMDGIVFITPEIHRKMKNTHVRPKDILLNITGGSIGRSTLISDDFDTANVSQHVAIVRMIELECRQYIHKLVTSNYFQSIIMDVQVGVSREGLSMGKLKLFKVPLPPLSEQRAIVKIVDELMALCDQLQERIEHREDVGADFLRASVRELLVATENKEA
ncbi:restriction endonuclease subunit S [Neolewinella agarilytica]|uniref:Type I restriction enzyme, S subunit n=1 Tax=Neolewinella agarilytica TaxID=478744 RepID=A0A1H9M6B8_9BACT|nr:restriction endonuclease subunit S [Neolewinella agarilytica]SER19009.1 type I restriction enzyme, S subunit [Neolewinella agarilytica]